MSSPTALIEEARRMALNVFPTETDAIARGVRLMELLLSHPWGNYSKAIEDEITQIAGRFGHKKPDIVLAGGGTSVATWDGSRGDLLNPAAFVRIEINGEFQKPHSVTFSAVVKGTVSDCYASHRYIHMAVDAQNYRIYGTT